MRKRRVAFVNTHPIQYFAPMYRMMNQSDDLSITALYLSDFSIRGERDRAFGQVVKWDVDLLGGYEARFVAGAHERPEPAGFTSALAPAIWAEVRDGRYDAIVVHGHTPAALLLAVAAAKSCGTAVFMRGETHLGLSRRPLKALLRKPLMGGLYRAVDGVLAIGAANADFYRAMGVPERRIFSMPYTIDNDRFMAGARADGEERAHVRAELGADGNEPIILYAAKFQRRKRPDDLIRAAHRLQEAGVAFHLAMVGTGELEQELRDLVAGLGLTRMRFNGFVNQSALPKVYAASDIFVLPSVDEPWGLAINEAMCAGLPIVASEEIGCVRDLVRHDVNGRTFRGGDVEGLERALLPLLQSPSTRERMGAQSLEIISRWSYEKCRQGLREALVATLERDAAAPADHDG